MHGGSSLYELDEEALAATEPDLILTQELCHVCAVSYQEVNEVARRIDADITVVSLEPTSIEGILNTITTVGAMAEVEDAAIDLVEGLRERLGAVEQRVARPAGWRPIDPLASSALEWLDPPFAVGHWVPEQIRRAGGWDLLGLDESKAHQTTWDAVAEVDPEMLFLMPCGFHLAETIDEWSRTPHPAWLGDLPAARRGAVFAVDGSAYFSRPGPRVIDGIEMLAEIMDPSRLRRRRAAGWLGTGRGRLSALSGLLLVPVVRRRRTRRARRTTSRAGRSCARTASARPATTASSASGCGRPWPSGLGLGRAMGPPPAVSTAVAEPPTAPVTSTVADVDQP